MQVGEIKEKREESINNKKIKRSLSDDLLRDINVSKHLDPSLSVARYCSRKSNI